jgi:hypothetical protein
MLTLKNLYKIAIPKDDTYCLGMGQLTSIENGIYTFSNVMEFKTKKIINKRKTLLTNSFELSMLKVINSNDKDAIEYFNILKKLENSEESNNNEFTVGEPVFVKYGKSEELRIFLGKLSDNQYLVCTKSAYDNNYVKNPNNCAFHMIIVDNIKKIK